MRVVHPQSVVLSFAIALAGVQRACADFVLYTLPPDGPILILEGAAHREARSIVYTHPNPKFGTLTFHGSTAELFEVEDVDAIFSRSLKQAIKAEDADATFDLALQALRYGWVGTKEKPGRFEKAFRATLELDDGHKKAIAVRKIMRKLQAEIPEGDEEKTMRTHVPFDRMKVATSDHFVLLHDLSPKKTGKRTAVNPRVNERLELLERVYRTFYLYFTAKGLELEVPKERLMVVLFQDHKDYLDFSKSLDPALVGTAGFYDPILNISFFYDNSSDKMYQALSAMADELADDVSKIKRQVGNAGTLIQMSKLISALVEIYRENLDLSVVTHEATHQLAANSDLFPRQVRVPKWVHEGLATYFETPKDAVWAGIGAVNEERIDWYRGLENDREHSNIDFIVSDEIFTLAATGGSLLHAYGQSWALTHFLIDQHFDKLDRFYGLLDDLPPDTPLDAKAYRELFDKVFDPSQRSQLDQEWRGYMNRLQTSWQEVQKLVQEKAAKKKK